MPAAVTIADPAAEMHRMFGGAMSEQPRPCPAIAKLYHQLLDFARRAEHQGDQPTADRVRRQAADLLRCDQPTPCIG